ncbi:MAG: winged helix-turn-helix domain-containing protein [Prevotella sp.]
MTEKKTVTVAEAAKKTTATKKASVKKVDLVINAESVGFRAGDVYQALAAANKDLKVAEISKAAKISSDEVLLGIGWLLKEGKIKVEENLFTLA